MKHLSLLLFFFAAVSLFITGCASGNNGVESESKHSSMPHNLPQSWEGQSRMGGMGGGYY